MSDEQLRERMGFYMAIALCDSLPRTLRQNAFQRFREVKAEREGVAV